MLSSKTEPIALISFIEFLHQEELFESLGPKGIAHVFETGHRLFFFRAKSKAFLIRF